MKINYTSCPVCGSKNLQYKLSAKDHTVSNEVFDILECNNCTLRVTKGVEDEEGIGKYYKSDNYISHSDTTKGAVNFLYHKVRQVTLKSKRNFLIKSVKLKKGKLLDIGAGTGAFASFMKQNEWEVTGLEPDENARKTAFDLHGIELLPSDQLFQIGSESFDAITMWHVLEHVHKLNEYIIELKRLIKPQGKIFIAVPNYTSLDAQKYKQNWAAYDVPRHLYHFSPQSMRQLLLKHQLHLDEIKPMWFDSFYVSMLSEEYKSSKSNLPKALISGSASNFRALKNKEQASSLIYIISKSPSS